MFLRSKNIFGADMNSMRGQLGVLTEWVGWARIKIATRLGGRRAQYSYVLVVEVDDSMRPCGAWRLVRERRS